VARFAIFSVRWELLHNLLLLSHWRKEGSEGERKGDSICPVPLTNNLEYVALRRLMWLVPAPPS